MSLYLVADIDNITDNFKAVIKQTNPWSTEAVKFRLNIKTSCLFALDEVIF